MYRFSLILIVVAFVTWAAIAQDKNPGFNFNNDHFQAGSTVVHDADGVDDLFLIGANVRSEKDISGSAHLVGRKIVSNGIIGGNAYLSGMDITLDGKVVGDVTIAGYNVQTADVDGDLRASGDMLTLDGPVSGYALVSGDEVKFNSVVKGDVSLNADEVDFAEASRIEGKLTIYEEKVGETEIPANVISEDRIERRNASEWGQADAAEAADGVGTKLIGFFKSVLFITALAALIAAVRPKKLTDLRQSILTQPLHSLLFGFLAISATLGGTILILVAGIGFRLALVAFLMAALGAFIGYAIGAYAIGVKAQQFTNRPEPNSLGTTAIAAAVGGIIVSLIGLIPYLGWIVIIAVTLLGAGAITIRLFRPKLLGAG